MPSRYGQPMQSLVLEEWCEKAASDARDWYTAEERYEACMLFSRHVARIGKREAPFKSVVVEGEPGSGKTMICNYATALMAATYGTDTYTDGSFGYGYMLTTEEMLGGYNWLEKGSVMFIDEANQFDRIGRDNSDIQEIRASHYQVVRKNQCTILNASANADRMSRGTRSRCDEFWHPQKLAVKFSEEAKRRLGRQGRGSGPRGRGNPAHFAYAVLKAKDRPFRPASIFDAALGTERDPNAGVPIFRQVLYISWMRKVAPMFDTFKKVPVGAALGVRREDVVNLATGHAPASFQGVNIQYIESIGFLVHAFQTGLLTIPPDVGIGGIYHPQYMRVSEILAATGSPLGNTKFSKILRDDLGLASDRSKGYEIGELYEVVLEAWADLESTLDSLEKQPGIELSELPSARRRSVERSE